MAGIFKSICQHDSVMPRFLRRASPSHPSLSRVDGNYAEAYRRGEVACHPEVASAARGDFFSVATQFFGREKARTRELAHALGLVFPNAPAQALMRRIACNENINVVERILEESEALVYDHQSPRVRAFEARLRPMQRLCRRVIDDRRLDYFHFMLLTTEYLSLVAATKPNGELPHLPDPRPLRDFATGLWNRLRGRPRLGNNLFLAVSNFPHGFYAADFSEIPFEAVPRRFRAWEIGEHPVTLYGHNEFSRAFDETREMPDLGSENFSNHDYLHGNTFVSRLHGLLWEGSSVVPFLPRSLLEYVRPARNFRERNLRVQTWMGRKRLEYEESLAGFTPEDARLSQGIWHYFSHDHFLLDLNEFAQATRASRGRNPALVSLKKNLAQNKIFPATRSHLREALGHFGQVLGFSTSTELPKPDFFL